MVICIECSQQTKEQLDRLVAEFGYTDFAECIAAGVQNLITISHAMGSSNYLEILQSAKSEDLASSTPTSTLTVGRNGPASTSTKDPSPSLSELPKSQHTRGLAELALSNISADRVPTVSEPDDMWSNATAVPIDRWFFGQYNKLLPAKVSCRAVLTRTSRSLLRLADLETISMEIAKLAADLRVYLAELDENEGRKRDEAFASAFPNVHEKNAYKGLKRYSTQFVGASTKQRSLSGLPWSLKLLNVEGSKIGLTLAGLDFARLENPILDGGERSPDRFSPEEIEFLMNHIKSSVPVERCAYKRMVDLIQQGTNTPTSIDEALELDAPSGITKSFLRTQRSGVISRMFDLQLLRREKDGTAVSYVLTELGKNEFGELK